MAIFARVSCIYISFNIHIFCSHHPSVKIIAQVYLKKRFIDIRSNLNFNNKQVSFFFCYYSGT